MWEYMRERARRSAEYILLTGATVRECARHFQVSKSTVYKDVAERLEEIDVSLWEAVRGVLEKNLAERHLRGGAATQRKYSALRARR